MHCRCFKHLAQPAYIALRAIGAALATHSPRTARARRYGIDPCGKLRIGSKICSELLGKLLVDLESMREESMATLVR